MDLSPYLPHLLLLAGGVVAVALLWYFVLREGDDASLSAIERLEAVSAKARRRQREAEKAADAALSRLSDIIADSKASAATMMRRLR